MKFIIEAEYSNRRIKIPAESLEEVYQIADAFDRDGLNVCWIEVETDSGKKYVILMYWQKQERIDLVENFIQFLNKD